MDDTPPVSLMMFPKIGTYVLLAIDPELTLQALQDPEVDAITKNITPRTFAACVLNVR